MVKYYAYRLVHRHTAYVTPRQKKKKMHEKSQCFLSTKCHPCLSVNALGMRNIYLWLLLLSYFAGSV